jgi:hypothetical protein
MQNIPSEFLEIDRKARVYMPYQDLSCPPTGVFVILEMWVIPLDSDRAMLEASAASLPRSASLHAGLPVP